MCDLLEAEDRDLPIRQPHCEHSAVLRGGIFELEYTAAHGEGSCERARERERKRE
jgi:hypothetical protein